MYSVQSVKPAEHGWWEVEIMGPQSISISMNRWRPSATGEDIWSMAQDWCDEQNRKHGFTKQNRAEALAAFKRIGATVNFDRKL